MRKALWIVLAALFAAIVAPSAHADSTYSATFTCNSPCTSLPTSPGVTFPTVPGLVPISVTWDNITYMSAFPTITPSTFLQSNDLPTDSYQWTALDTVTGLLNPASLFIIFDQTDGTYTTSSYGPCTQPCIASTDAIIDTGSLTFAPSVPTVPEPSSNVLLLTGLALCAWMVRRGISLGN